MTFRTNMIVTILCLSLVSITTHAQSVRNKQLEKVFHQISKQEFLFTDFRLSKKSKRLATQLCKLANEKELIQLSQMECKLCFSYSFWVLSKQHSGLAKKMYEDYDKTENKDLIVINKCRNRKGCVKIMYTEANFMFEVHTKHTYLNEIQSHHD